MKPHESYAQITQKRIREIRGWNCGALASPKQWQHLQTTRVFCGFLVWNDTGADSGARQAAPGKWPQLEKR